MAKIDKLLKYLNSPNVAEFLDDEHLDEIAKSTVIGYQIDDDSRQEWLETNKEAVRIVNNADNNSDLNKDFPFDGAAKVIYPLIGPAIIQLASRLIEHTVRNDTVMSCAVLGKDQPEIDPQTQQPTGFGIKEQKAKRISDYYNYKFLIKSDSWLADEHKLCHIVSGWGTGFKRVYHDPVTNENCSEVIPPEDVIINHNTISLDKCRRITIRHYLTKNDIIEQQRAGLFLDIDLDKLDHHTTDNEDQQNDSRDKHPVYEFLQQFRYLDLDDDDYEECYSVWVHNKSEKVLGIYPAFELQDIETDPNNGSIKYIKPRTYIVDQHLINNPEGKFYSLGLNALLLHQNKAITAILRMLLDSGILANTQGGFVTKAFKTKSRSIRFKLGQFETVETNPNVDLSKQIMPLPFKEPSQVLLALLQMMVESGEKTGFMSDILAGDAQQQNVPATTALAMIEQATRAFKPVVQKMFMARKKEFKMHFHLDALNPDKKEYLAFQGQDGQVAANDFDETALDVVPVADPTMASEGHKYARLQAMIQVWGTQAMSGCNLQEQLLRFYTELQFPSPEMLVSKPQPPQPDPTKMAELQLKQQLAQADQQIAQLKMQLQSEKNQLEAAKVNIKQQEVNIKEGQAKVQTQKTIVDAHKEAQDVVNSQQQIKIQQYEAQTDRQRVNKMGSGNGTNV